MEEVQKLREWKLRSSLPEDLELSQVLNQLKQATGLSETTLRVCMMRGLTTPEAISDFLNPKLESLKDPFCLKDMDRAVDRLVQARDRGEMIRVFGDYDVDGTTGAAMLTWFFRDCGFTFEVRQPDRFKDGYGLNVGAVEVAHEAGAKVLVTVDCGITSFDAANRAQELGIDLIVVDHHQIDAVKGLPQAHAIVNPQRSECDSGLKQLCGCALAFYLVRALRSRGRDLKWWPEGREPNLKQHLDLVVMATAADMVPLTGDNHILVRHGLEVLKLSKKPGVRALLEAAGVGSKDLSPGHLGFVIGPRINASGRISSASHAMDLLTTTDAVVAASLAQDLERMNQERAQIQNRIWDEVRRKVEEGIAQGKFKHGVVVADASWHEGVVGIVASRVTETFRRPAAVIALREDFGKGSVRSYGGKDVLQGLRQSAEFLLGFGGHKHAAGLSVALDRVEQFAEAFDSALGEMQEDAASQPLYIEGECSIEALDLKTLEELERLGPFGPGNPEPVFLFRAAAKSHSILKGRHLKLHLSCTPSVQQSASQSSDGGSLGLYTPRIPTIEAIWFHAAERQEIMNENAFTSESEWAGVPEINRFRGRSTPTLRIRDWRKLSF